VRPVRFAEIINHLFEIRASRGTILSRLVG